MESTFRIEVPRRFDRHCRGLPKYVWESFDTKVVPTLRRQPRGEDFQDITKLRGWTDLWRYRIGKYRVVYSIHGDRVRIAKIGKRGDVYRHLGHIDYLGPSHKILEDYPTHVEASRKEELIQGVDKLQDPDAGPPVQLSGDQEAELPQTLSEAWLGERGVPERYWPHFTPLQTEGDMWSLWGSENVPEEEFGKVLEGLYPSPLEELLDDQAPSRVVEAHQDFGQAMIEGQSIESFALRLDPSQQQFVATFDRPTPVGPWIVQGGPGTGKSVMALYCVQALYQARQKTLFSASASTKILFTTYTKALRNMSEHLLKQLAVPVGKTDGEVQVEVKNVDALASDLLATGGVKVTRLNHEGITKFLEELLEDEGMHSAHDEHAELAPDFLAAEIEEVILASALGVGDRDTYLTMARSGRGVPLQPTQRERVWKIYLKFDAMLADRKASTFQHAFVCASATATKSYDYVFIDEAHDLSPAAIRMCVRLCKRHEHVFLAVDRNQAIHRAALSWEAMQNELVGVSTTAIQQVRLRRNYRTTREICEGIAFLWKTQTDDQSGLRPDDAVEDGGEYGAFATSSDNDNEIRQIERFLRKSLLEERLDLSCAAILCPNGADCKNLKARLDPSFKPKFMTSGNFSADYRGVRLMPFQSVKGLDFPVVVVARVGTEPVRPGGFDDEQQAGYINRLFLVACSRAQRRLMVSAFGKTPAVLEGINGSKWELLDS